MERVRKSVATLLNDGWNSVLMDFGCISSRILFIKFRFSRFKVCVGVGYGPNEERDLARRILPDRSVWWWFVMGNVWGITRGINP